MKKIKKKIKKKKIKGLICRVNKKCGGIIL